MDADVVGHDFDGSVTGRGFRDVNQGEKLCSERDVPTTVRGSRKELGATDVLPSGLVMPQKMTKVHIPDQDFERIRLYVNQVVRGLYSNKVGRPMPANFGIHTYILIDHMRQIQPVFKPMIAMLADKLDTSNQPVFLYAVGQSEDSEHCLIVTEFYQTAAFGSLIGPVEWIENKKRIVGVEGSQVDKLSYAPKTITQ
jgi:hypothetical protein